MKALSLQVLALGIAAVLAACSGSSAPSASMPSVEGSAQTSLGSATSDGLLGTVNRQTSSTIVRSWVSPEATSTATLLFVSDTTKNDVLMLSWPKVKLLGSLSVPNPNGECTDSSGNVWVTSDPGNGQNAIYEYSHSGTLVTSVSDAYGYPFDCAINPKNGDMAVSNFVGYGADGNVVLYKMPSATPTVLDDTAQQHYYYDGYDTKGKLWVDGWTANSRSQAVFALSQCRASSCKTVTLTGGTIYFPGMVEWDKYTKTWLVGDTSCGALYATADCVYSVAQNGAIGTQTWLYNQHGGNLCLMRTGLLIDHGKSLLGEDSSDCGSQPASILLWKYPAGGKAKNLYDTNLGEPSGVALSTK